MSEFAVREIEVPVRALSRLEPLVGAQRYKELCSAASTAKDVLRGKTLWNVSSTAAGGGVAEMLQVLVGYTLDAEVDIRWLVIGGDADFFSITKRVHNRLHGAEGDDGALGAAEARHYETVTAANLAGVLRRVKRGDVVLLHDPQTAGLAAPLAQAGAVVVWRCHVGRETSNSHTDEAWEFLRPYLGICSAYVFSLREYVPAWIDDDKVWVIPPSIDPFSPKNQDLGDDEVIAIMSRIGIVSADGGPGNRTEFTRRDGSAGHVAGSASILTSEGPMLGPMDRLVLQVSRWDRLKDMEGVMEGFASGVVGRVDAHLALVGPSTADVSDDPEGAQVVADCISAWGALPAQARRRIHLITLPMDDIDENAVMVNAIQRHATVIVQKSLAEGFGLTVAEGMWKARAVVASGVGGITAQIAPGTGLLLEDPTDLEAFGETLAALLESPAQITDLGEQARRHVLERFVGDRHLMSYARLIEWLASR
jgi:trehalose synthase